MFLLFLIKNLCLLALCFSIIFPFYNDALPNLQLYIYLISLLSLSLSYIANYKIKYPWIRYVFSIGILSCIFLDISIVNIILVLFIFAYSLATNIYKLFSVEYYEFKTLFLRSFAGVCVISFIMYFGGFSDVFLDKSMPNILIFLISGLYIMRTSRHSIEVISSKRYTIINIIFIFLALSVIFMISSGYAIKFMLSIVGFIYQKFCIPILMVFVYIMSWIIDFVIRFLALFIDPKRLENAESNLSRFESEALKFLEESNYAAAQNVFQIIAICLIIVVSIIILFWIISKSKASKPFEADGVRQSRSTMDSSVLNKRYKDDLKGNSGQIRKIYIKFLNLCKIKDIDILPYDGSESIQIKSNNKFDKMEYELVKLKKIYQTARYSDNEINGDSVEEIKKIYKKLASDKNDR